MSAAGAGNNDTNSNDIIFTIKYTKWFVAVVTLSARGNQKISKLLIKWFKRSVYWKEYKTKSKNKNTANEYRYFLEWNFVGVKLFALVYSNLDADSKRFKTPRYYLPKGIITIYNFIINGKNLYYQPIDSGIKQYLEIRKLTTEQDEGYATGILLEHDYIKNHYGLVVVDLSRQ